MAQQKIDYNIVLIGGLLVGGFFVVKSILQKLNIVDNPEEKAAKNKATKDLKEQERVLNIWAGTVNLAKSLPKNKKAQILTKAGAESYAKQINDAFGIFNDNEEKVFAVFRNIRFQTQVSSLVDAFNRLYRKDLLSFLRAKLSETEFNTITDIISQKNKGVI
jgi:hypothetical protein